MLKGRRRAEILDALKHRHLRGKQILVSVLDWDVWNEELQDAYGSRLPSRSGRFSDSKPASPSSEGSRLLALAGNDVDSWMREVLKVRLLLLRSQPSLRAYVDAWQTAAFVCAMAVSLSGSLQDQLRARMVLFPHIRNPFVFRPPQGQAGEPIVLWGWLNQLRGPPVVRIRLRQVPARDPAEPILNEDGTPLRKDLNFHFSLEEVERVRKQKEPRLDLDLTNIGFGRVTLDLGDTAAAVGDDTSTVSPENRAGGHAGNSPEDTRAGNPR